jgi:O86/O127-antigen biosynthesis alpha-1,3-N-acetylgalactosaminyltransferase
MINAISEKPRLLFVITKSEVGGAQKYVREQIDIATEEFDVYLASNQEGWLTDTIGDKLAGSLLDARIESLTSPGFFFRLNSFIRKNKIDLVVCNSANGGLYGRLAAFMGGCKSVYVSHGWSSIYNGGRLGFVFNMAERLLGYIGNAVVCVSAMDMEKARGIGIPERKIRILKNAIFPVEIPTTHVAKQNETFNLLAVTRLDHPKRVDLLIAAAAEAPGLSLTIVGGGGQYEQLTTLVDKKGYSNIALLGERRNFDEFARYDAFALISDSEGLPMSALEAMSAGLPLILSNVGGCGELIDGNGVLVNNTVEEIKEGLGELMQKRDIFASRSKAVFDRDFNLLRNKDMFTGFYKSIIKSK